MAPNGNKQKHKSPYNTAYQRAKVKAIRHQWPSAATAGLVPVHRLIKTILKKKEDLQILKGKNPELFKRTASKKVKSTPLQQGYPFRQTSKRRPPGWHLTQNPNDSKTRTPYSFVYTFQFIAAKAQATYIVQAFYYEQVDTFMMKFFNSSHKSLNKYAARTGSGDFPAILRTNFDILMHLHKHFPESSFGFIGERSFFKDKSTGNTLLEPMENNQRFRIYQLFLQQPARNSWLTENFKNYSFQALSTLLLLNKKVLDSLTPQKATSRILNFMATAYPQLNYSDL